MIIALGLGIAGWLGVIYVLSNVHPTLLAKAAFLAVWAIALMGTAWPSPTGAGFASEAARSVAAMASPSRRTGACRSRW